MLLMIRMLTYCVQVAIILHLIHPEIFLKRVTLRGIDIWLKKRLLILLFGSNCFVSDFTCFEYMFVCVEFSQCGVLILLFAEPSYEYTVDELALELENRILSAIDTGAFTSDILAAVVS